MRIPPYSGVRGSVFRLLYGQFGEVVASHKYVIYHGLESLYEMQLYRLFILSYVMSRVNVPNRRTSVQLSQNNLFVSGVRIPGNLGTVNCANW